jgi:hypothetical protein
VTFLKAELDEIKSTMITKGDLVDLIRPQPPLQPSQQSADGVPFQPPRKMRKKKH